MTDTNAIDEKKEKEGKDKSSGSFASNIVGYLTSILSIFMVILLYFAGSSLTLFVCKLAQSNILPTEYNCFPYTDNKPTIQPIKTNIFTTFTDPEMSMKLQFPYDEFNSTNKLIDLFRTYKHKSDSHFFPNYIIAIVEQLISFNYSAINTIMNSLNGLPEPLIVALGPIIVGCLFAIMTVVNTLYTAYLWFCNMSWFFKTNTNDSGEGMPEWSDVTFTTPLNWCLAIGLVVLFILLFFLGFGLVSLVSFAILCYCCLTCIMYKSVLNDKKMTSLGIIKEVLKYYKSGVVGMTSFFVIALAFSKLGVVPGIFSVIILALMYWGIFSSDLFKPIPESNLTPSVRYEQAAKKCAFSKSKKTQHGFLYNMLIGQKGGSITHDLQKLSKQLS